MIGSDSCFRVGKTHPHNVRGPKSYGHGHKWSQELRSCQDGKSLFIVIGYLKQQIDNILCLCESYDYDD